MENADNKIKVKDVEVKENVEKVVIQERKINKIGHVVIDRDEEDRDVLEFQKTGDMKLLEKVYLNRIPTLWYWTNKYYYPGLMASANDLFSELAVVFVKAAEHYDGRAAFNTCLYTFFDNRIKNIKSGKYAKKRISEEYKGPLVNMVLSLDYSYNDKDGTEVTLKDVIPSKETLNKVHVARDHMFNETINILSTGDDKTRKFLEKLGGGESMSSILKEYRTRTGSIKISRNQAKKIGDHSKRAVKKIIKKNVEDKFELVNYKVKNCSTLDYEIELKKTKEADEVMRTIRELRKNKEYYLEKIKGIE